MKRERCPHQRRHGACDDCERISASRVTEIRAEPCKHEWVEHHCVKCNAERNVWARAAETKYPVAVLLDGNETVLTLAQARRIRDELVAAVLDAEAKIALRAAPSPEHVREALQALAKYIHLRDGERGANGAIWTALRALSPELAKLAEDDPESLTRALGCYPEDEEADDAEP